MSSTQAFYTRLPEFIEYVESQNIGSFLLWKPTEDQLMDRAVTVSEIVDFRSMAVVGQGDASERALTQVKGVDAAWPLLGQAVLVARR